MQSVGTPAYPDKIGNGNNIVSLMTPLIDNSGNRIGLLVADLPVENIYEGVELIKYLKSGETAVVYSDGEILKTNGKGWWSNSYTNMHDVPDKDF